MVGTLLAFAAGLMIRVVQLLFVEQFYAAAAAAFLCALGLAIVAAYYLVEAVLLAQAEKRTTAPVARWPSEAGMGGLAIMGIIFCVSLTVKAIGGTARAVREQRAARQELKAAEQRLEESKRELEASLRRLEETMKHVPCRDERGRYTPCKAVRLAPAALPTASAPAADREFERALYRAAQDTDRQLRAEGKWPELIDTCPLIPGDPRACWKRRIALLEAISANLETEEADREIVSKEITQLRYKIMEAAH